jgi:hypothetical protein
MCLYIYMVISVQVNIHVGVNICYIYIYGWMWKIHVNTFNEEDNYIGKVVGVDVIMFLEDKNVEFSTKLLA